MEARDIPLAKLRVRSDARPLDLKALDALVESVRDVGFTSSALVRPKVIFESGQEAEGFEIIAGRHRFEAAQRLGFETLPCRVCEHDDLHAELAMLDENLKRSGYGPAADAQAVARRKEIYEILHPQARHGGDRKSDQVAESATCSFADATAKATGRSARTVRVVAERGNKISDRALQLVAGTHLDTGTFLDKIKDLGPKEQEARVQRELAAERPQRRPVSPAPEPRNEIEAFEAWLARGVKWFETGPEEWRERAREHLYPDVPVMDRRHA